MLRTERYVRLAGDIPPCTTDTAVETHRFGKEARRLDGEDEAIRIRVCSRIVGIVMGNQCAGTMTPAEGA